MAQNMDIESFHVNTVKLHGEVRKADIDTTTWQTKDGIEKESQKIVIKVDDDNCDRIELVDKDISHMELYKRGTMGTFTLRLDIAKEFGNKYSAKIFIIDFKEDKK